MSGLALVQQGAGRGRRPPQRRHDHHARARHRPARSARARGRAARGAGAGSVAGALGLAPEDVIVRAADTDAAGFALGVGGGILDA